MVIVAMDRLERKRGHTNGNVFGGFIRRGVLDPLSRMRNHSLASRHLEHSSLMADAQPATQHDGVLLKLRRLSRLFPSRGAAHVGDADRQAVATAAGVYPA